jgi:hypothetical protein
MGITRVNADGLVERYGTRVAENVIPSEYEVDGMVREYVTDVDFASINSSIAGTVLGVTTADLANRGDIVGIPSGAVILDTFFKVEVPFVGDTVEVDVVTAAKVADAGSPATGIASAAGAAVGTVHGAAFTANLAQLSYVDAVPTLGAAGLTAGSGKITVRYTLG